MKSSIFLLLFLFLNFQSQASFFTEANEAYQNKDFPKAIDLYQESLQNAQSLAQHFNLANAYYENKDYAHSILHYNKALTFAPNNPDVLKNLSLAKEALHIKPQKTHFLERLINVLSPYAWSIIFITSLSLGLIFFILSLFFLNKAWLQIPLWASVILLVISLSLHFYFSNKLKSGIVLANNATLRISATSTSPVISQIPEGTTIKVIKVRDNLHQWSFVKNISNGQEGWLNNNDFGLIWYP